MATGLGPLSACPPEPLQSPARAEKKSTKVWLSQHIRPEQEGVAEPCLGPRVQAGGRPVGVSHQQGSHKGQRERTLSVWAWPPRGSRPGGGGLGAVDCMHTCHRTGRSWRQQAVTALLSTWHLGGSCRPSSSRPELRDWVGSQAPWPQQEHVPSLASLLRTLLHRLPLSTSGMKRSLQVLRGLAVLSGGKSAGEGLSFAGEKCLGPAPPHMNGVPANVPQPSSLARALAAAGSPTSRGQARLPDACAPGPSLTSSAHSAGVPSSLKAPPLAGKHHRAWSPCLPCIQNLAGCLVASSPQMADP